MVSEADLVRHLLGASLLRPETLFDGDLTIDEVPRRNRNFRVETRSGACYFIKQGIGVEGEASLAREASAYRYLNGRVTSGELYQALPRFLGYDERQCLLVLGLSPGSLSLREFHARRGHVPRLAASRIGAALAELHGIRPQDAGSAAHSPAWPLLLGRPSVRMLRNASGANLELIRVIQDFPEFCLLLDGLRAEWAPSSLIHFDLKADNCLIDPPSRAGARRPDIKIVDWETWGFGDPRWDVGSIFADFLGVWLLSIPILADAPSERLPGLARFPLDRMAPAIRAFWIAYEQKLGLTTSEASETLLLAVRYSAARLLQTAFEQMQASQRLNSNIVSMLQLSWNVLQRPGEAASQLLGIET